MNARLAAVLAFALIIFGAAGARAETPPTYFPILPNCNGPLVGQGALPSFCPPALGPADGGTGSTGLSGLRLGNGANPDTAVPLNAPNGVPTLDALGNASSLPVIALGSNAARTLAELAADGFNVKNNGAKGDGVTDDGQHVEDTFAQAANGGVVTAPCGVYKIVTRNIAQTLANLGHITFIGGGSDCTELWFSGGNDGLTINAGGLYASASFYGVSITTDQVGGSQPGLSLVNNNFLAGSNNLSFGSNNFYDVVFRGHTAFTATTPTQYWGTGFYDKSFSEVNFWGGSCNNGTGNYHGICYSINGAAGEEAIVINFNATATFNCGTSLLYGPYVEGIYLHQFQSTGCNIGVDISPNSNPTNFIHDSLAVDNSQFEDFQVAIKNEDAAFSSFQFTGGNLIIVIGIAPWTVNTTYAAGNTASANAGVYTETATTCASAPVTGNITAGSGYTNGTYFNVAMTGGSGTGMLATVIVASGSITSVVATQGGSGYVIGDSLSASGLGGGTGFHWTLVTFPTGPTGFGTGIVDNNCLWNYSGTIATTNYWAQSTSYAVNNVRLIYSSATAANFYRETATSCTSAGSGTGPTGTGTGIVDNTCAWNYVGPYTPQVGIQNEGTGNQITNSIVAGVWSTWTTGIVTTFSPLTSAGTQIADMDIGGFGEGITCGYGVTTCYNWITGINPEGNTNDYVLKAGSAGGLFITDKTLRNLANIIPCSAGITGGNGVSSFIQADSTAAAWNGVAAGGGGAVVQIVCSTDGNFRNQ